MLPRTVERKLTAILSADVVGYSRLIAEDDATTVKNLKRYREVIAGHIESFRGRVVDSPGDNLLAEFNSVVNAVQCAVDIQRDLALRNSRIPEAQNMAFRIGVNLGEVIQDGDRIYGEGVNVAARLESLAEPGGILVSGIVYDQVKKKLDLEYEFLARKDLKNIEEPVDVYRVLPKKVPDSIGSARAKEKQMAFPLPQKPSIAILPFTNMSGEPEQEYIGDGISENIITALSMSSGMFVIARNSTFTYKGRAVKVQQVAEELGVQYVLEGSIQKYADRLRITAQLIDALTGHHLWAEKYDRRMGDLLDLQDEITKKIVVSLQVGLTQGEQARIYAKSTDNLEAWSYATRGNSLLDRVNKEDNVKARELFESAIKLDPGYVLAYVWLGVTHALDAINGWSEPPKASLKLAHELARKALALDEQSASAHAALGMIYLFEKRYDEAVNEGIRSIALDQNFSIGYAMLARTMFYAGRFGKAVELIKKAMRFSPYYPAFYLDPLARSYAFLERYEEAITTCEELNYRAEKGEYPPELGLIYLARISLELGREEEGRALMVEALRRNPSLSLESFQQAQPFKDSADLNREIELYRRAGMPDKSSPILH